MGFWDFFKKNKIIEKEIVKFEGLEKWLDNKRDEHKKQEQTFQKEVYEILRQLIEDFRKEIPILKCVEVDKKKAEDKIKLVVKENRDIYTHQLERLLSNLEGLVQDKSKEINLVETINSIFLDFEKKSRPSFEKATFLIGEELGNVEGSIKTFFRKFKSILDENKETIEGLKVISLCEIKIKNLNEQIKNQQDIKKDLTQKEKKTDNLKVQIKLKEKEIESVKYSQKYLLEIKKRETLNAKKEELDRDISVLRSTIDFKALTNFFHTFEKEMNIIKQYKENFKETFNKTEGKDLIFLFEEAKLESEKIKSIIKQITERQNDMKKIVLEDTGVEDKEKMIKEILSEIEKIKEEILTLEKRDKKLKDLMEQGKKEIKEEIERINVDLI